MRVAVELRWAVYTVALSLTWLVMECIVGLQDRLVDYNASVRWFALFIPAVCFYVAVKRKRDTKPGGAFTFGEYLLSGLMMTFVATALFVPMQVAFHHWINPAFYDNMIQHDVQQAVNNSRNPRAAYDAAKGTYNATSYAVQTTVGFIVFGVLLSFLYANWFTRDASFRLVHSPTQSTID